MSDDPEYDVDFRANPGRYEIGRGEDGVFKVQPYKSELLPLWTSETPAETEESAAIHESYEEWADEGKREAALRFEKRLEGVREDEAYRQAEEERRE